MKGIPSFFICLLLSLLLLAACTGNDQLEQRNREIADSIRMNDSIQVQQWLDSLATEGDSVQQLLKSREDSLQENR